MSKTIYLPFLCRNFGLLSFGEEAEVDEMETSMFTQKNAGKAKSMHDAIDDPKLSKETVQAEETMMDSSVGTEDEEETNDVVNKIRKRLECAADKPDVNETKKSGASIENISEMKNHDSPDDESNDDEDHLKTVDEEKKIEHAKKR